MRQNKSWFVEPCICRRHRCARARGGGGGIHESNLAGHPPYRTPHSAEVFIAAMVLVHFYPIDLKAYTALMKDLKECPAD